MMIIKHSFLLELKVFKKNITLKKKSMKDPKLIHLNSKLKKFMIVVIKLK